MTTDPALPLQFVHLHVHTQYSFLQSTIRVPELVKFVKAEPTIEGVKPAIALTDTNNIFGAIDFYFSCKDAGIKPIIGCELLYCPEGRFGVFEEKGKGKQLHQLVVLCKDKNGYQNLSKLLTKAYLDGASNKTGHSDFARGVVDRELLDQFGEGLIVLSGSIRGEISYKILMGLDEEANEAITWFKKRFKDDFYLEVVDNGITEQDSVNQRLIEFSRNHEVELVGTSESYYANPTFSEAQEVLQCIPLGRNLDFERPKSLVVPEFYLKPASVMREKLAPYPNAFENTVRIAEKCNLEFKFKDEKGKAIYHLPKFRPEGVSKEEKFDSITFFEKEARDGLEVRFSEPDFAGVPGVLTGKRELPEWSELEKVYRARLEEEIKMIAATGFADYFLIVSDFIKWAKGEKIPVGPGRGSGAGSLVAYCLQITDVDPIEFKLLFERFINPERVSMPDFDIDFCQERRGEVIEYVERKYGKDNVAQIITFGKLQTKAVIKDVGRVMGLSFAETDQITKLVPPELNIKLKDAYESAADLRDKIESDTKLKKVWEYALQLEGLYRGAGMHAAGIIITEEPIVNYCPLYVSKDGDVVTQFDKDFSEKIGLIKYDFLGLKTLTVIDNAVKFVRDQKGQEDFDLKRINYKDSKVFEFISSGNTNGVFQIESDGMKDLCKRIIPNSLDDITAINALYRPGPLGSGMVDDFIDRKHGRTQTTYELPVLEPILKETYGVILYQEQVMQIARDVAGYTLGQADMLRRAMGKKKADEMAKHKEIFIKGATERSVDPTVAGNLFDLMAKFAEYGFNKSHSAAYGFITYQTAFLKTYYPVEFMAALMTTEMSDTDKLSKYIADARAMNIEVLPPDVNESVNGFTVVPYDGQNGGRNKAIRFGLEAIKGVGGAAVEVMIEARGGMVPTNRFVNILDFCKRVPMRKVNKKVLESLSIAGGFDSIANGINRASLVASIENLIDYGSDAQATAELGQSSLFEDFKAEEVRLSAPESSIIKTEPDWPLAKRLLLEKQTLGFYISGHPMQNWQNICNDWLGTTTDTLKELAANAKPAPAVAAGQWGKNAPKKREVKFAGVVSEFREIVTKKGTKMAFIKIEDMNGAVEVIAFPDFYAGHLELINQVKSSPDPVMVTGELDIKEGEPKVLATQMLLLEQAHSGRTVTVVVEIDPNAVQIDQLRQMKQFILGNRGKSPLRVHFVAQEWRGKMDLPKQLMVAGTPQFAAGINKIFGKTVARLT